MVKQSQLAERWGLTKGRVSQLVKAGMPLDSIESAEAWRAANSKEGIGHKSNSPSSTAAAKAISVRAPRRAAASAADPSGVLERRREIELRAYNIIASALATAEKIQREIEATESSDSAAIRGALANVDAAYAALPGLIRNYNAAAENALAAEMRWEKHCRSTGDVAPVSQLFDALRGRLEPLASQLRNLPRQAASAANPPDPACAERAIEAQLDPILRQIAAAQKP